MFGHLGDRYGRRRPLTVAILLIATCTTAIGLMPTYASIGIAAPILITLARLLQGVSVGGEYGGALAFISEYAPEKRRGSATGWLTFSIGLATLIGAGTATLLTASLSPADLESWGWRLPFLVGLPLGFVGLYMRLRLEETPHFAVVARHLEVESTSLRAGIRREWRSLLLGMGLFATPVLTIYVYFIYSPTYLTRELGYSPAQGQIANLTALAVYCLLLPVGARLCDRVGRRPMLLVGAAAVALVTYPAFAVLGSGNVVVAAVTLSVTAVCFVPISAAALAAIAELFPTTFRYTGASLSLNIPATILGGPAPLVATALIAATGDVAAPAWLVIAAGATSFVAALVYSETLGVELRPGSRTSDSTTRTPGGAQ